MKNVFTFAGLAFCACSGSSTTPIDATATSDSRKAVDAAVDARELDARVIDKDGRLDVFVIDRREPALAAINIYRNICGG